MLVAWITMSEVGQQISNVIRSIVLSVLDVLIPIVNILGVASIIFGLILALGLRQEYLGWRLIVSGGIMLIFVHVVVPLLLSFI